MATTKPLKVTVVGAASLVGREVLKAFDESEMLLVDVTLLDTGDEIGETLTCQGADVIVDDIAKADFSKAEAVLFCGSAKQTAAYAPKALQTKALVLDAAHTLEAPCLVTDVENPQKWADFTNKGAVLPNPVAASLALVFNQIGAKYPLVDAVVSTYHSVAHAGMGAVQEVANQSIGLLGGGNSEEGFTSETFAHQAAFNVLPQVGTFQENGLTTEEADIENGLKALLKQPVCVSVSCAYVPTFVGEGIDVTLTFKKAPTPAELRALFSPLQGTMVLDDPTKAEYATPYGSAETSYVFISRVRAVAGDNRVRLWVVADHLRIMLARKLVRLVEVLAHQERVN